MTVLFANNATSRIPADLPAGSTTVTLMAGEGARFPQPVAPGDLFMLTLEDRRTSQIEICRCIGRSGDILNVVRGQEGTTAQTFIKGASAANRMTAGTITAFFGIPEAPQDHKPYAREDQTWVETITKVDFDANNLALDGELDALDTRVTATETKNTEQDGRLTAVETVNTTQNTRLTNVETKNTAQDTRLTNIETVNTNQDTAIASKIGDAPSDTKVYGRKDATWAEIVAGGGSVTVSPNPPPAPIANQLWWDSNAGITAIYFGGAWVALAGFIQNASGAFTDDFNRADGNLETSASWTRVGGTAGALQVNSNRVRCNTSGADTAYQAPDQGTADHYAQYKLLDVAMLPSGSSFLCCRLADADNYVGVRWTGTVWSIYRKEAGSYIGLVSVAGPAVVGDVVKLQCVGTNYELFVNGVSLFTGPLGTVGLTSTRTGVVARAALQDPWFDEFVTAPQSVGVPPVFTFPSSPANGQTYSPQNGPTYVYESPIWKIKPATALVPTQDTPPATPAGGQLWWKSSNGALYIWYEDGDSGQWVQASPTNGGSSGIAEAPLDGNAYARKSASWVRTETALAKNLIVNPSMQVSQENGFTSGGGSSPFYFADQWSASRTLSAGTYTAQLLSVITPKNSPNRLRVSCTAPLTTVTISDQLLISQVIEGSRIAGLGWGGANAKPAVLRFGCWGHAGTYGLSLRNAAGATTYVANFTIPVSFEDNEIIIPIPPPAVGTTWASDAALGVTIGIALVAGSTYVGNNNAWQAANKLAGPGISNFLTGSNVFELFDVGLYADPGNTGLPPRFEVPDLGHAMRECQRYWQYMPGLMLETNINYLPFTHATAMRVAPAVAGGGAGFTLHVGLTTYSGMYQTTRAQQNMVFNARM